MARNEPRANRFDADHKKRQDRSHVRRNFLASVCDPRRIFLSRFVNGNRPASSTFWLFLHYPDAKELNSENEGIMKPRLLMVLEIIIEFARNWECICSF